jgi:hypothetical protein
LDYPGFPLVGETHQVFQDEEGFLWINTENGLFIYDGQSVNRVELKGDSLTELTSSWHLSMMQDEQGKLWFGYRGKAITSYDKKDNSIIHYSSKDGYPTRAWHILAYKSQIWIADEKGLIKFDPITNEWSLFAFDNSYNLTKKLKTVRYIIPDEKENKFWLATYVGLMEFNLDTYEFQAVPMKNINPDPRRGDWLIIDLYKKGDDLFCTSWGGGLLKYNIIEKSWSQYYTETQKEDLVLFQIEALNDNEFLCTGFNTPPLVFNQELETLSPYQSPLIDEFENLRYSDACLLDNNGFLWISNDKTTCGLNLKTNIPKVSSPYIKKVIVDNSTVEKNGLYYHDPLFYSASPNSVRFEFNTLNYEPSVKYQYQYKLEGFDKGWINCGENTSASYSSLAGGSYTFKVRSSNENSDWLEARPVSIKIKKLFYQKWWFILGVTSGLFSLLAAFYFIKMKRIKEKEALKTKHNKELLEMEMMALRAQMNPHFMFNSLNSINQFIMTNEPRVASKYLSKFAQLMRSILNNSKEQEVALEDELKMISLYMEMEGLRFKQRFEQTISIDPSLNASKLKCSMKLIPSICNLWTLAPNSTPLFSFPLTIGRICGLSIDTIACLDLFPSKNFPDCCSNIVLIVDRLFKY